MTSTKTLAFGKPGRLEVVHKHREVEIWRQFEQERHVIGLTVHCEQFATATSTARFGYLSAPTQHFCIDALPPILGAQN